MHSRGTGAQFLVVEDDVLEARSFARILRRYGHVTVAHTLADARKRSEESHPTAAMVDWMLPDGDGLGFVERLRFRFPRLPIVLMTGHLDPTCINRAHLLGAEYVCKPPSPDNIRSFAERALKPADPQPDCEALALEWASVYALSTNETEVLRLVMLRVPRPEIARRMSISQNTLKTYVKRMLAKTRAESVGALARRILEETLTV